jgi:hypothetical protein
MEGSHIKEKATDQDKLQQKFKALQQDWDSYKQSNPRTLRRYSTDNSKAMAKALQLLDCSPRNLVSSLQHRLSPSEGGWKIRTNDLAIEEIPRERMAVVESGRLKGRRRLFDQAPEGETEMAFGGREKICNSWNGLVQETEVRSVSSFYNSEDDHENNESGGSKDLPVSSSSSSSLSSLSGEKVGGVLEEEDKVVARVETRRVAYGGRGKINGRSWMVIVMGLLAIASIVYAICINVPLRSFGGYGDDREMLLVPT